MQMQLDRQLRTKRSTIGTLSIGGQFECYTLEDVERPVKIMHETAIPAGTYQIIIDFSNRFQRLMPLLLNVPGFSGIRIHSGNTDKDTSGCILLGTSRAVDRVNNSRTAYAKFFQKLQAAYKKEKIFITVK
jgi:hypothetical protein